MLAATEILQAYGKIGVQRIKQLLESVRATGKTIDSVKEEVTETGTVSRLIFAMRPYGSAIETGIKPTDKGVSKEMIDSLTEYARARGMQNPESAAWGIAKTIQKKGDKTYRKGGRNVYSEAVTNLVTDIKKEIRKDYKIKFTSVIKNSF